MGAIKEYWCTWLWPDVTRRIITVNTLVWLAISALSLVVSPDAWREVIGFLAMPASASALLHRPWTALAYMFTQVDFLHLLCNMLWLLLFGRLSQQPLGQKKVGWLYVAGGLAGALAFAICNAIAPGPHSMMMGASCAVAAVIGTVLVMMPNWRVNLLMFGRVKVLWVGIAAIAFFAWAEASLYVGVAHAAGLLVGLVYGFARLKGLTNMRRANVRTIIDEVSDEQALDNLLAKVGRSGYGSLNAAERNKLFQLSQRIRK